jgi:para-nitrobenzyl esterase
MGDETPYDDFCSGSDRSSMPSAFAQVPNSIVSVEGGMIQGVAADVAGITVCKAIPFAAPLIGPVAWSGVKDSSSWPNRCYQLASANPPGSFYAPTSGSVFR